jgi:hypothetical protein
VTFPTVKRPLGTNVVSVLVTLLAHIFQTIWPGELDSKTGEHDEKSDKVHHLAENLYCV